MIKSLLLSCAVSLCGLSAHADTTPIEKLQEAFKQQQGKASESAAGGVCVSALIFTKIGLISNRADSVCYPYFVDTAFVNNYVAQNKLVFVLRNNFMDIVLIPNGALGPGTTPPKGNFYYIVNYDESRRVSEVTLFNDALP